MDGIFNKLGIYDFMGIWGSGAVMLCYSFLSFLLVSKFDIISMLQEFNTDYSLLSIFIFCITAYIIGVYLHELGKLFCEFIGTDFNINHIKDINTKMCSCCAAKSKKPLLHPIKYRKHCVFQQLNKLKSNITLDEAISYLKHKEATKLIDKYHSIYGFTRGILIGFCFHFLVFVILTIIHHFKLTMACISLFDLFSIYLFYIRTYRYYTTWVKNVFIQYDLKIKSNIGGKKPWT